MATCACGACNSGPALIAAASMDTSPRCTLAIHAHEPTVLTNHECSELVGIAHLGRLLNGNLLGNTKMVSFVKAVGVLWLTNW